jgi:hypothetical protein
MKSFIELARLAREAQVELCIWHNERALRRAQRDLGAALDARDRLRADQRIAEHRDREAAALPVYLVRKS